MAQVKPQLPVCVSHDAILHTSVFQAGMGKDQGTVFSAIRDDQRGHSVDHIAF